MGNSILKVKSNIMKKDRYQKEGSMFFIPYDMLPEGQGLKDIRANGFLSPYQKTQKLKSSYYAEKFITEYEELE